MLTIKMIKIKYPTLTITLEAFFESNEPKVTYKNNVYTFNNNILKFEHIVQSLTDTVEIKFNNFVANDKDQKVKVRIYHNNIKKDSKSVCTFSMQDNLYVENKVLENYDTVYFNGVLKIKFFKRWFECNILNGNQILNSRNLPVQWIIDYNENSLTSLRVDPQIKKYDIICLGCSFTYGEGLARSQSWPDIIAQQTKLKIGNFGVQGCGIDGIYKQFLFVKKYFKTEKIIILLPYFERQRIKFLFGDNFVELLLTANTSTTCLGDDNTKELVKVLLQRHKIGCKYIDRLSKHKNVFMTSYVEEVYSKIPLKNRLPKYPDLKTFKDRAIDGCHPSHNHNKLFVDKILEESSIIHANS